jgi:predicted nucleic acid-binding protein
MKCGLKITVTEKRLYDTRFFAEYFYSEDIELLKKLKQEAKQVKEKNVSALTIHELYRINAKRSGREVATLRSHTIREEFKIVDVNYKIAIQSAELRIKHSMPMADSVIAVTALIYGCTLVSDDVHFRDIPNLKTRWFI